MKFCPKCGTDNPQEYNYCGKCRELLPNTYAPPQGYGQPAQPYYQPQPYPQVGYYGSMEQQNRELAEKYATYGVIWGLIGLLVFTPLCLVALYYGFKARGLDSSKGMGGIILGSLGIIIGILIVIFFLVIFSSF